MAKNMEFRGGCLKEKDSNCETGEVVLRIKEN